MPARAEGEGAQVPYAMVGDGGNVMQQGAGSLRGLADLAAGARRVVLLLAASDVTLVHVKVPPLPAAKLRAALPGLVEDLILSDPADCAIVAAPAVSPDGTRTIAVVQRAWFEALVKSVLALGVRSVGALPLQLCLPLQPGGASAAIESRELAVRTGLYEGLGLALDEAPAAALATARALAAGAPLTVYAPPALVEELRNAAAGMSPAVTVEAESWTDWIAGAKSTTLDLVPALGSAGMQKRDWQQWRWAVRLAVAAVVINLIGLNVQWLRLKREADAVRQSINQTFKAAYPNQPIVDAVAQMKQNVSRARASGGQVGANEFTFQAAAFGEAVRAVARKPAVASLEFRDGGSIIKVRPDSFDRATLEQLRVAMAARGLTLTDEGPTWRLSSGGVRK